SAATIAVLLKVLLPVRPQVSRVQQMMRPVSRWQTFRFPQFKLNCWIWHSKRPALSRFSRTLKIAAKRRSLLQQPASSWISPFALYRMQNRLRIGAGEFVMRIWAFIAPKGNFKVRRDISNWRPRWPRPLKIGAEIA